MTIPPHRSVHDRRAKGRLLGGSGPWGSSRSRVVCVLRAGAWRPAPEARLSGAPRSFDHCGSLWSDRGRSPRNPLPPSSDRSGCRPFRPSGSSRSSPRRCRSARASGPGTPAARPGTAAAAAPDCAARSRSSFRWTERSRRTNRAGGRAPPRPRAPDSRTFRVTSSSMASTLPLLGDHAPCSFAVTNANAPQKIDSVISTVGGQAITPRSLPTTRGRLPGCDPVAVELQETHEDRR
jgi:hypothetical protein